MSRGDKKLYKYYFRLAKTFAQTRPSVGMQMCDVAFCHASNDTERKKVEKLKQQIKEKM